MKKIWRNILKEGNKGRKQRKMNGRNIIINKMEAILNLKKSGKTEILGEKKDSKKRWMKKERKKLTWKVKDKKT